MWEIRQVETDPKSLKEGIEKLEADEFTLHHILDGRIWYTLVGYKAPQIIFKLNKDKDIIGKEEQAPPKKRGRPKKA